MITNTEKLFEAIEAGAVNAVRPSIDIQKLGRDLVQACREAEEIGEWSSPLKITRKQLLMLWWSGKVPPGIISEGDAETVAVICDRAIENLRVATVVNPVVARIANECYSQGYQLPCST